MDDRSVRRSLDVLKNSMLRAESNETALVLMQPTQSLVNRFVLLMSEQKDIDIKQVFESSVSIKEMVDHASQKGLLIDMTYFNEQST